MPESQVVSFRAGGSFLQWLESNRVLDESASQAASRLLRSFAVSSHLSEVKPLDCATSEYRDIVDQYRSSLVGVDADKVLKAATRLLRAFASSTRDVKPVNRLNPDDDTASVIADNLAAWRLQDSTAFYSEPENSSSIILLESLQKESEELRSQLEAVSDVRLKLQDSVADFESQLEAGRNDYDELENLLESTKTDVLLLQAENDSLKQTISKFAPVPQFDSAVMLSKLRTSNKKSAASLADIQFVVELVLQQLNFF